LAAGRIIGIYVPKCNWHAAGGSDKLKAVFGIMELGGSRGRWQIENKQRRVGQPAFVSSFCRDASQMVMDTRRPIGRNAAAMPESDAAAESW
jgi:hypothetical protein